MAVARYWIQEVNKGKITRSASSIFIGVSLYVIDF